MVAASWVPGNVCGMLNCHGSTIIDARPPYHEKKLTYNFRGKRSGGAGTRLGLSNPAGQRQVCWAHLARDFRAVSERRLPADQRLGRQLLRIATGVFAAYNDYREHHDPRRLADQLEPIQTRMRKLLGPVSRGRRAKTAGFAADLLKRWPSLWLLADHPNLVELGRVGARCAPFGASVSPTRPPNRTCVSPRIRLSARSCRWLPGLVPRGRDLLASPVDGDRSLFEVG